MKSVLIIGLGDFGHHLCRNIASLKNEIMIVDKKEEAVADLMDITTSCLIADCTESGVLQRIGVTNFDLCYVCIGNNFRDSLIITNRLKELGASYVISQTNDELLAGFLLNNGADEIIHPNKDTSLRVAVKHTNDHIFDYIELRSGYSIYEITPLREWVGKSILESNIRAKYNIYIISIHGPQNGDIPMPGPKTVICADDHLTVLSSEETMDNLMKRMDK
ncbi:MAG: TrkA family potassium uptake protein [Oscillospiraceae bacterium]|nr:TrkA family potassium uptake protein [Oscillospiraceae bacterium]